jgi:hypothetical protein
LRSIDNRKRWADMPTLSRHFLKLAAALGATVAWGCATVRPSSSGWRGKWGQSAFLVPQKGVRDK